MKTISGNEKESNDRRCRSYGCMVKVKGMIRISDKHKHRVKRVVSNVCLSYVGSIPTMSTKVNY